MGDKAIYDVGLEDYLKGRIQFLRNKIKEIKNEISLAEQALADLDKVTEKQIVESPNQLSIPEIAPLDFSVTRWKPQVFNFLFENQSKFTTEQILIGIDGAKEYQTTAKDRNKAIKTISSCLFQLHKSSQVEKHENDGRRGFKWSIKDTTEVYLTAIAAG